MPVPPIQLNYSSSINYSFNMAHIEKDIYIYIFLIQIF